jgi:hypothetical protein
MDFQDDYSDKLHFPVRMEAPDFTALSSVIPQGSCSLSPLN